MGLLRNGGGQSRYPGTAVVYDVVVQDGKTHIPAPGGIEIFEQGRVNRVAGKTWNEKLHPDNNLPRVVHREGKRLKKLGQDTMVVPSPVEVDEIMRAVETGKVVTTEVIRSALARRHGTATACPLTTGMFAIIAAFASEERAMEGRTDITPYWRTLKPDGELNVRYPGGIDNQKALLESEGHVVVQRRKRFFVKDYQNALKDM